MAELWEKDNMTHKSGQVYRISPKGRRKGQYYSKSSYILKAFGQGTGQTCLHRHLAASKDTDSFEECGLFGAWRSHGAKGEE